MRYMERGGFQNHPLMRLSIGLSLVFIAGLWLTNFAMYFERMGLSASSVQAYYLGSEALFRRPRTFGAMLETTHAHLPIIAVVVLLVTHLLIFAPWSEARRRGLIFATFAAAFLNEGAGWLVRFVHPAFAWLKVAAFISLQSLLGLAIGALAAFLWGHRRRPRRA